MSVWIFPSRTLHGISIGLGAKDNEFKWVMKDSNFVIVEVKEKNDNKVTDEKQIWQAITLADVT